jgi:hypothetical protein
MILKLSLTGIKRKAVGQERRNEETNGSTKKQEQGY